MSMSPIREVAQVSHTHAHTHTQTHTHTHTPRGTYVGNSTSPVHVISRPALTSLTTSLLASSATCSSSSSACRLQKQHKNTRVNKPSHSRAAKTKTHA